MLQIYSCQVLIPQEDSLAVNIRSYYTANLDPGGGEKCFAALYSVMTGTCSHQFIACIVYRKLTSIAPDNRVSCSPDRILQETMTALILQSATSPVIISQEYTT
jgi:hypothetical protein